MHADDLKIKNTGSRCYVEFYFNGERVREYTGKNLLLNIVPNRASTPEKRLEQLMELKLALLKHINEGNYPAKSQQTTPTPRKYSVVEALDMALQLKLKAKLSRQYKADLQQIHKQFLQFLCDAQTSYSLSDIQVPLLEQFLSQFNSSGTYYMKKRSDLGILFSLAAKLTNSKSIARDTHTERSKATLHRAYNKEQIKAILSFLLGNCPQLHLCCLLTYGCWLRPHVEVLSLKKKQIKNDCTEIHLSGTENKGGKVRVVYIPPYVKRHLEPILETLEQEDNIFTCKLEVLNKHYFTTRWKRLRQQMLTAGLIENGQTIYSFRHSAAIEVYKKTKDIYLLQKMMGHSSIGVTQKYLRSLGQVDIEELKNAAPTL